MFKLRFNFVAMFMIAIVAVCVVSAMPLNAMGVNDESEEALVELVTTATTVFGGGGGIVALEREIRAQSLCHKVCKAVLKSVTAVAVLACVMTIILSSDSSCIDENGIRLPTRRCAGLEAATALSGTVGFVGAVLLCLMNRRCQQFCARYSL